MVSFVRKTYIFVLLCPVFAVAKREGGL